MAYTNSSLVTYTKISPNRYSPRNHEIDTITIHCVVAQWTAKQTCDYFANSSVRASCNYAVGRDGSIGLCVEEKDGSWCSSSYSNDNRAITIEVASDTKHPYAVTDKALAALIELLADICKRNNIKELKWKADKSLIGQPDKQNMTVHRWFANKSCPGDYLYNKHSYIAEQVNKKLGVTSATSTPSVTPTPAAPSDSTFKINDIVNFAGGKQYKSSNASMGSTVKASKAKITNIAKNAKHPYHLRAVNDKGAFIGGVYGWVDASTVSEIKSETKVETTTKPTNTTNGIAAGTKLMLKNVALYVSSTTSVRASVLTGGYYTWDDKVVNNRIRITNTIDNVGKIVTGWINYTDAKNAVVTSSSVASSSATTSTFKPYNVKVTAKVGLNIRKGAGTLSKKIGALSYGSVVTISKVSGKWGYVANRGGWIHLDYTVKI